MYFYTQTEKKDQSSFTKYATFFIDKFPLACGGRPIYATDNGLTSEQRLVKVDQAATVTYQFEDKEHAKKFAQFQSQCLNCFKQDSEAEGAIYLLELLLTMKDQILSLPTSIKQVTCTIARFYLLLMPLFELIQQTHYEKAKELAANFITILIESNYALSFKIGR